MHGILKHIVIPTINRKPNEMHSIALKLDIVDKNGPTISCHTHCCCFPFTVIDIESMCSCVSVGREEGGRKYLMMILFNS